MTFGEDIELAAETMRQGGVIVYPTDTIWGIGCDATNSEAVRRVFELKRRSDSKALITLVSDINDIAIYTSVLPDSVITMINDCERPTTIIYPGARNLAPELLSSDGSVGIRVTRECVSSSICRILGRPLVSTSANISGEPSPSVFKEISSEILEKVDYVVEARRNDISRALPSRIVRLESDGSMTVIRS